MYIYKNRVGFSNVLFKTKLVSEHIIVNIIKNEEFTTMKTLRITKEQFEKSKYFTRKYGTLKFVSESGKLFKTDKGKVLRFDEGERREVVPMNGRASFGHKAMEEEDENGFTLFSYGTPVARLERRDDGSGLDFTLLGSYLSNTTLTHIHSWLIGHRQEDIPTKVLKTMEVGETVPMKTRPLFSEKSKKLVKEGAGAGYTVHIKDLKFGKIVEKKLVKGKERYDDYYECKVEVVPGEYEIAAEDYYNDFFWQEHEFGDTPTARIDGGIATVIYSPNSYDEDEAEEELRGYIEGCEIDISFGYGWGWQHINLPREKIEADHIDIETKDVYFGIDLLELNAPDLADAVNSGYKSIDDMENEEDNEDGEEVDESKLVEAASNDLTIEGKYAIKVNGKVMDASNSI